MNPQLDIEARLQQLGSKLSEDPDIDVVYLFGSYAKGRPGKLSDIDIGVLLSSRVPCDEFSIRRLAYMDRCAQVLQTDRVDVVLLNGAPIHLAYNVVTGGRVLFGRGARRRVTFEVDCINRFLDFKPFLDVQVKYMKDQIKRGTFFD